MTLSLRPAGMHGNTSAVLRATSDKRWMSRNSSLPPTSSTRGRFGDGLESGLGLRDLFRSLPLSSAPSKLAEVSESAHHTENGT